MPSADQGKQRQGIDNDAAQSDDPRILHRHLLQSHRLQVDRDVDQQRRKDGIKPHRHHRQKDSQTKRRQDIDQITVHEGKQQRAGKDCEIIAHPAKAAQTDAAENKFLAKRRDHNDVNQTQNHRRKLSLQNEFRGRKLNVGPAEHQRQNPDNKGQKQIQRQSDQHQSENIAPFALTMTEKPACLHLF